MNQIKQKQSLYLGVVCVSVLFLLTGLANAQETFSLSGRVLIPNNIGGASGVTLKLTGLGGNKITTSAGFNGTYSFTGLAPGNYTVVPVQGSRYGYTPFIKSC
jgi:hypothetical protein